MLSRCKDLESLLRLLPPSLPSFLNVSFISRDTPLLYFFPSLSSTPIIIIRSSLFLRCSIFLHPCIVVSLTCPHPRISASLSPRFLLFSLFSPPPPCPVFNSPRVFYIPLPPPHFSIFQSARPYLPSRLPVPGHPCRPYPFFLLSKFLVPRISSSIFGSILVIFINLIRPYTFHCSIKRPTRVYTCMYTKNCRRPGRRAGWQEGKSNTRVVSILRKYGSCPDRTIDELRVSWIETWRD